MERARESAKHIFDALGFTVEVLPEEDEERADLIVRDKLNCYVIENPTTPRGRIVVSAGVKTRLMFLIWFQDALKFGSLWSTQ